jgi:caffeoyl-CoA O-methyltransferase
MHPVDPAIMDYLQSLHSTEHACVAAMEDYAHAQGFPIIGRPAGQSLLVLALAIGARSICECGSGFGYSAYWFARAVGPQGRVICTEGEATNATRAENYLTESGLWDRIDFRVGHAQSTLAAAAHPFDLIYNDAYKDQYPEIWTLARSRIRPGGLYIADNCLWQGRVTHDPPLPEAHEG